MKGLRIVWGLVACGALAGCAASSRSIVPDFADNAPLLGFDPLACPVPSAAVLRENGFSDYEVGSLTDPAGAPTMATWTTGGGANVHLFHVPGPGGKRLVVGVTTSSDWGHDGPPQVGDLGGRVKELRPVGFLRQCGMLYATGQPDLYVGCRGLSRLRADGGRDVECNTLARIKDLARFGSFSSWGPFLPFAELEAKGEEMLRTKQLSEDLLDALRGQLAPTPAQRSLLQRLEVLDRRSTLASLLEQHFTGRLEYDRYPRLGDALFEEADFVQAATPARAASLRALGEIFHAETPLKAEDALDALAKRFLPAVRASNDGETKTAYEARMEEGPSRFSRDLHASLGQLLRARLWRLQGLRYLGGGDPAGAIQVHFARPVISMARVSQVKGAVRDVDSEVEVYGPVESNGRRIAELQGELGRIDAELGVQRGRLGTYAGDQAASGVVADRTKPGLKDAPKAEWQGGGQSASAGLRQADARERIAALEGERERKSRELATLAAPVKHTVKMSERKYADTRFEGWEARATVAVTVSAPDAAGSTAELRWSETFLEEMDWDKNKSAEYMLEYKVRPKLAIADLQRALAPVLGPRVAEASAGVADPTERALLRFYFGLEELPGDWERTVLGDLVPASVRR